MVDMRETRMQLHEDYTSQECNSIVQALHELHEFH